MLDLMARGASLGDVLDTLTRAIERISPGALCTVLLLDEVHRRNLLKCSGPSMPEEYLAAVNGLEIGPDVGACGSAAYRNQTIIVEDIATDFRFEQGREFVLSYGLRSCWSVPIRDSRGDVLGTFAMYHRVPIAAASRGTKDDAGGGSAGGKRHRENTCRTDFARDDPAS